LLRDGINTSELEAIIGSFATPFMHNRILMCVFSVVFAKLARMSYNTMIRWDPEIRDEMFMALLLMSLAEADIRAPVSAQISSTDATVQKSGSCVAEVTDGIAQLLFAQREKRGESVRLDWLEDELKWHPTTMNTPRTQN
jgi:hypothetical protein